ncbi:glycosyltransferase family 4 protein [Hymenobacter sp. CRA2]|uniref:glycosyltransferase family 4 protein n=1 Tax=Hymenobacter sp. CRA2 TaxID=1955620 RepID=UPI00098FAA2F|nr:glycosyltransferase family 4 protein [Hymenobacter sp. CRA2]OON65687.1 hypothetical protein B0919_23725 [Hymenobacter sp. CRA2]
MNVLWLAPFPHIRFPGTHAAPWLAALAAPLSRLPGVQLSVLNWDWGIEEDVDEYDHEGVHFIFLRAPRTTTDLLTCYQKRIAMMASYLRQHHHRYDVIHVHGSELQYQVAALQLQRPILLSVQGLVSECLKVLPEWFSLQRVLWTLSSYYESRTLPSIRHFSCRTHWDKAHVARLSPQATIHHNWEMLRPEFFTEPPAAPVTAERPQVVFMGGIQVLKGFREALQTFDQVRARIPAKLTVVGAATREQVLEQVQRVGLRHVEAADVECPGLLTAAQLVDVFRNSLCLLHPSYIDNSPNSVCEAQLAGLPVVATQVGGVSSLISHGTTGLLSELSPQQLSEQVLSLHADPALSQRLARNARAVALERHNPDTILQRTLSIYESLA